jgi:prevent-host-death family protein
MSTGVDRATVRDHIVQDLVQEATMTVISYSDARNRLKQLCDTVRRSRRPARIHRRGGDVVVIAAEDWDAIEETLQIVSIPGAVRRIKGAKGHRVLPSLTRAGLEKLIKR